MDRRSFIAITAALAAKTGILSAQKAPTIASPAAATGSVPDLVAIRGGLPSQMFDRAITALGGIENFVKKGQKVVVKPNIAWARTPEESANTTPELVAHIVELCLKAGAKEVKVFDHTCNEWQQCYQLSGIEKAAREAGANVIPAHSASYFTEVEIPKGKVLKKALVHKAWLEADSIINVPILKHHGGARMTSAMKNLMGTIWDRRYYHRNDLQQCIADFTSIDKKPTLNIVDAYNVMMRNGPRGRGTEDLSTKKFLLASTDIVAIDVAASSILGADLADIHYIKAADELGSGNANLKELKIERISI
ncbi:MAG: DUF362 domain-containing protein [Candidatus Rifleibacteriota bacterium]